MKQMGLTWPRMTTLNLILLFGAKGVLQGSEIRVNEFEKAGKHLHGLVVPSVKRHIHHAYEPPWGPWKAQGSTGTS